MASVSRKCMPSGYKKETHNTLRDPPCYADGEAANTIVKELDIDCHDEMALKIEDEIASEEFDSDCVDEMDMEIKTEILSEELYIDSDDEMDLEIKVEIASEESSSEKSESGTESETSFVRVHVWQDVTVGDKKPREYTFTKNAGPQLNLLPDAEPTDYFNLFFNNELLNNIIGETNRYARDKIAELQLSPRSIWSRWSDVSTPEMKAFLGLIINMGLIPLPDVKDYWSSEWTTQIKFFGDVMSRNRFLQIFWMMHVGNDTTEESSRAIKRTKKVHGVIEHMEKQFRNILCQGC
ncbi:piggyBac transposable element-derived protein 4 isoform X1 [Cryptotermes secundus]|uniref:piggyBac transposable element-derived protein 4 isoform X1 n=1 Tax=Cryptotermes secundus TaxID=105785 RepID=UPI000CD7AFF3|nr:piggyBac transposable element-derived protein 4 isoform X1 [Cryptotermes secundus]